MSKPWSVTVEPFKKKRTLSQNGLYWKWLERTVDIVARETGNDKDDLHDIFKEKFLTPKIVEFDGQVHRKYSTKNLTTAEMSEYMNRIYAFVTSQLGIILPIPEELHRDAA